MDLEKASSTNISNKVNNNNTSSIYSTSRSSKGLCEGRANIQHNYEGHMINKENSLGEH